MAQYKRDHLTSEDVAAILMAAKSLEQEPGDYLFLLLLAKTGRRIGEILGDPAKGRKGIMPKSIEWSQKFIWLSVEKRRDDAEYICFINDEMVSELAKYIKLAGIGLDDELFLHRPKRSAIGTFKTLPQLYADIAGIGKHISAHSFRHHFITTLREQGWSYEDIQKLTGHKDVASLAKYDHTSAKMVEERFRNALGVL